MKADVILRESTDLLETKTKKLLNYPPKPYQNRNIYMVCITRNCNGTISAPMFSTTRKYYCALVFTHLRRHRCTLYFHAFNSLMTLQLQTAGDRSGAVPT